MHIFELPPELFMSIMEQTVVTLELRRALRARLVCKTFDRGLTGAIFTTAAIEKHRDSYGWVGKPIPAKWLVKLLEIRALERPRKHNRLLDTVHETVSRIMHQCGKEDEEMRFACLSSVCQAVASWYHFTGWLIDAISEDEPYHHNETVMMRGCLAAAAWMGNSQLVEAFSGVDDINDDSSDLPSALWAAARQGNMEIFQQLLHKGARGTISSNGAACLIGSTPFQSACWGGNKELVRLLMETNPNIEPADIEKGLRCAASGNHVELVQFLLERFEFREEAKSVALHGACFYGAEDTTRLMLDRGTSTKYLNYAFKYLQPLATASKHGHLAIVRLLVSRGVDLNFSTGARHPDAVLLAASRGYIRIVEVLLDAGAQITTSIDDDTLARVAERGHEDMVKFLLDRGYPIGKGNKYDKKEGGEGRFVLGSACEQGQTSIVRLLAEYGVDIHSPNCYRIEELPIITAKRNGHDNVVDTLLELGVQKPKELDSIQGKKSPFLL